jgi:hypothetical protein
MSCNNSSSAVGRRFDIQLHNLLPQATAANAAGRRQLLTNIGDRCERGSLMHYQPTLESTVVFEKYLARGPLSC